MSSMFDLAIMLQQFKAGCPYRYVLSNIESKQGVRKGDRIWQIAFGSGFKCNSAVWRAMRTINDQHSAWVEAPTVAEA